MSQLKFLILDANVVIHLHEFGIWSKVIESCEVHLSRTVVGEADYFECESEKRPIDIQHDIDQQRIHVFDVSLTDIQSFRNQFDALYVGGLDAGECESLAWLCQRREPFLISSGDAIVYRILGLLNKSDQGISLEEFLQKIGLQQRTLPWSCRKAFREKYTKEGEIHFVQGVGLTKKQKAR